MIQRRRLADTLAARAFTGQTVTVSRASGETVERHFFDNRLGLAMLTRLDRLVVGTAPVTGRAGAPDPVGAAQAQDHAARLAAGNGIATSICSPTTPPPPAPACSSPRNAGACPVAATKPPKRRRRKAASSVDAAVTRVDAAS